MSCCCEDGVKVSKMALETKSGQMLYHKRRIFGRNWREVYVSLYNDSTMAWYRDKGMMEQEGGVVLKEAPELLAYGQFTSMIPNIPELPDGYSQKELLAVGTRGRDTVHWFLCPSEQEVENWMTAISNTLPPPPQPKQAFFEPPPLPPPTPVTPQGYEQQPPMVPPQGYEQQPPMAPALQTMPQGQPFYIQQPNTMGIPGQYPTPTSFRAPYNNASPLQPAYSQGTLVRPQQGTANNTTVVVQDRRYDGGTGGDFAMGMLVGGAIGTTVGHSWGHGYGWGWGGGGGWHHSSGPTINDTDVTVNNYYDVDHTVINNDIDIDASRDMTIIADDVGFDSGDIGGDFDVGDLGGF